jgi:hypothetical protein
VSDAPSPEKILQTGMGFWASKTLLSAIEMGVFTTLAQGPQPLEALRVAFGLHARSAHDFFDALVALGFLRREAECYANAPDAELFLDKRKPSYVGGILEMGGSSFERDLPQADVVLMGHILHDWDLPTKQMLVRKAYAALPPGGALIVYESIIDDARSSNAFGLLMSLNMLIETPGGFDYTASDCVGWMRQAGFTSTHAQHLVGPDSMVVGIK